MGVDGINVNIVCPFARADALKSFQTQYLDVPEASAWVTFMDHCDNVETAIVRVRVVGAPGFKSLSGECTLVFRVHRSVLAGRALCAPGPCLVARSGG